MSDVRRSERVLASVTAGVLIGVVEVVFAISFAALVFGGYLAQFLPDGIGLFLVAAAISLAILAWRSGSRGVVGGVQAAVVAVLAVVATTTALHTFGSSNRAFVTVVAATMVVTILTGVTFLVIGTFKRGNLIRFVPYPVVGGFLAGTGWLLLKGGIYVASGEEVHLGTIGSLVDTETLRHWLPALAFGVILFLAVRLVKTPLAIPIVLAAGLALFAIGMLVTGSSIDDARTGLWMVGPYRSGWLFQPWTYRALTGADWWAVLGQAAGIATVVLVAVIGVQFNVSGTELVLRRDLDTDEELRNAGLLNVVSGAFGGVPGYHSLSMTALAERMNVDARAAGLIAALVPLAAVVFGAAMIELIPRMIVGGVLVFLGLTFIVDWVWDKRRTLPKVEYVVVLVILAGIIVKGFLPGVVIGLVHGRRAVRGQLRADRTGARGRVRRRPTAATSTVHPPSERPYGRWANGSRSCACTGSCSSDRPTACSIGSAKRVEHGASPVPADGPPAGDGRGLLGGGVVRQGRSTSRRRTGSSSCSRARRIRYASSSNEAAWPPSKGSSGSSRTWITASSGARTSCWRRAGPSGARTTDGDALAGMPPGLRAYLERVSLAEGAVLIRQDEPPGDVFVLESGRLRVEMVTHEGTRMRLRAVRPGVVVGEIAMYTGATRTADVVAETPSVVLRLSRASIERIEAERSGARRGAAPMARRRRCRNG